MHRIPNLGTSLRLHTLFKRCHDVDDFFRGFALSRNLDLRSPLLNLGA
jgi:hypothetical protein